MNTTPTFKSAITKTCLFVLVLWLIKTSEQLFHLKLQLLGVYPGELSGLIGILTAPLIHGSYEHLFSNTLPTLILGTVLFYGYPKSSKWVIPLVWIGSGIGVWLFARDSYHVGASGLTHGIFFYLLITSILRRDKRSIALMMIAFFMYGSMVLTILPREQQISFEYHLFGAIFGVLSAAIFYKWDPKLERKKYDWENEHEPDDPLPTIENDEIDLIGDAWKLDNQAYDDIKSYDKYRH
ncbi:rhomboid family intramembrane serine protease [Paraneptunicella aestuarii]|uniref:rhomboid family intramembrane serine protease n=1 Tax=Paraneptunicella aestuarii TaxID=2831148 RepID=UPI001E4287E5|nr:rhomboid family intramembrane serine protease [Paraneptunicella aestuarii]UAA37283.1 rhomboid family intramembrane serine protease [Paraneptunicella aestuarii]